MKQTINFHYHRRLPLSITRHVLVLWQTISIVLIIIWFGVRLLKIRVLVHEAAITQELQGSLG